MFVYGDFPTLFIAMPLVGFSRPLGFSAFQTLFADLVPKAQRGKVMGSMNFFTYIFSAIGAVSGGILYDNVSPQAPFISMLILLIPCFLITLLFVHEPERREE